VNRLFLALSFLAGSLLHAETFKPCHVLSVSGTAALTRFEDEPWPLEEGQDLPADFRLSLEKGASMRLRFFKRLDLAVAGPAVLRCFALEQPEGQLSLWNLVLRPESGSYWVDPRFLLGRPSQIRLEFPDTNFDLSGPQAFLTQVSPGLPTAFSLVSQDSIQEAARAEGAFVTITAKSGQASQWPQELLELAAAPLKVLLLGRDYDAELNAWPKPAILGPAMLAALQDLEGIALVDGSGDTRLARHANGAIKKGEDFFLAKLGMERGARFVVAGNLVSEELQDESPKFRHNPLMQAVAELRVIEAMPGGESVAQESATAVIPRKLRSLEIVGPEVMRDAAAKIGPRLKDVMADLIQGHPHSRILLKVVFNGVRKEWYSELRRGLGNQESLSQFFKRSHSHGIFKADLLLRKSPEEFELELRDYPFDGFWLEEEEEKAQGLAFTLRPKR
jgi:hypothetical protein